MERGNCLGGAFWVPFLVFGEVELDTYGVLDAFFAEVEVEGVVDFVERKNEAIGGGVRVSPASG